MSENSTTATETTAEKTVDMYVPEAAVNEMLGVLGIPFPDAAELDHVIIHVDHSVLVNSTDQSGEKT